MKMRAGVVFQSCFWPRGWHQCERGTGGEGAGGEVREKEKLETEA
jgi:hypothetical protein